MKQLLFTKVNCIGYLKRIYDGKFVETYEHDKLAATYKNSNDESFSIESDCCGVLDFLKTYYEVKEKKFSGFIVGFKDIVTDGYLVTDVDCGYYGGEYLRIFKHSKTIKKCAIVYFADNKKRFVPIEMIQEA